MSIKDSIFKMIKLTDKLETMNKDIKSMTDDLIRVDRRLVRVETIVEISEKRLNREIMENENNKDRLITELDKQQ